MAQSTKRARPGKPHKDYPLFAHANGQWCKKVLGRLHYFGKWDDPDGALRLWLDQKDDLLAGRTPRAGQDGLTVKDLANRYLTAKRLQMTSGELQPKTFRDYYATCEKILAAFGKRRLVEDLATEDFGTFRAHLAEDLGPVSLSNEIRRTRQLFKWGYDNGLIGQPVRFGTEFKRPSVRTLRLDRAKKPVRLFSADEIRTLLAADITPQMRAMILLGINCGMGNADLSELPVSALDLQAGWINYPRPKTGVDRRCPLWRETVEALRDVLARRKTPRDEADNDLVFITKYGSRYVRVQDSQVEHPDGRQRTSSIDGIALEFGKILKGLGIRRTGVGFYSLRHAFRTTADATGDQRAIDAIMGHKRESDIANVYTHGVDDARLLRVAKHVHDWLFPPKKTTGKGQRKKGGTKRTEAVQ